MPCQLRLEYPGAMYHVMSRGNRRQAIFMDDVDRHDFFRTRAEACPKSAWQVHAFCLLSNHYHLVLETPNANLVAGMAWLQSTYIIRFKLGSHHAGELRRETAAAKGGRMVAEELQRVGWSPSELRRRRKNDPDKMRIAVRLRRETTLSLKDIAVRVHLGTSNTANARLHSAMKALGLAGSSQRSVGI